MNIAIVGAGIVGLSTALELARDGHQVTLYEQRHAVAEDASFAPGGWLAPGALQLLGSPHHSLAPAALRSAQPPILDGRAWPGSAAWRWQRQWQHCAQQATTAPLRDWIHYSDSLRAPQAAPLHSAEHTQGALVLLRSATQAAQCEQLLRPTSGAAAPWPAQRLTPQQAQALEPGLAPEHDWHGALHLSTAQALNPRLWTQHLRQQLHALGVRLWTGVTVQRLHTQPVAIQAQGQTVAYDAIVLCTGAHHGLHTALGLRLPSLGVAGYSITVPVRDALLAPRASVLDWGAQATITRMGQRVRITAGAHVSNDPQAPLHAPTLQRMYQLLGDWFPGGMQLSSPQTQTWRGLRCILPDGLPATGPSPHPGIWLNLAHGSHGIGLAAGTARALADLVQQRRPALDMAPLHPLRFQR